MMSKNEQRKTDGTSFDCWNYRSHISIRDEVWAAVVRQNLIWKFHDLEAKLDEVKSRGPCNDTSAEISVIFIAVVGGKNSF